VMVMAGDAMWCGEGGCRGKSKCLVVRYRTSTRVPVPGTRLLTVVCGNGVLSGIRVCRTYVEDFCLQGRCAIGAP
jgi:hypothetical protein